MCRIRYTTTIDEDLLLSAKNMAHSDGLEGANALIEKALRLYFQNHTVTVWEKPCGEYLVQKLTVRPSRLVHEVIARRQVKTDYNQGSVRDLVLENKGWHKTWHMSK